MADASCTGSETTIRILEMNVFETVVRSVIDVLSRAGYALPGINSLVSVEQQGDHSSVGIVVELVDKFYQIGLLYQILLIRQAITMILSLTF